MGMPPPPQLLSLELTYSHLDRITGPSFLQEYTCDASVLLPPQLMGGCVGTWNHIKQWSQFGIPFGPGHATRVDVILGCGNALPFTPGFGMLAYLPGSQSLPVGQYWQAGRDLFSFGAVSMRLNATPAYWGMIENEALTAPQPIATGSITTVANGRGIRMEIESQADMGGGFLAYTRSFILAVCPELQPCQPAPPGGSPPTIVGGPLAFNPGSITGGNDAAIQAAMGANPLTKGGCCG